MKIKKQVKEFYLKENFFNSQIEQNRIRGSFTNRNRKITIFQNET